MARKKILFISHIASRSGAPMLLLYLLQWIRRTEDFDFDILILHDGELNDEFKKIARTYSAEGILKTKSLAYKISRKLKPISWDQEMTKIVRYLGRNKYDLVYGNTIICLPLLLKFKELFKTGTVAAIHELEYVLSLSQTNEYLSQHLNEIDKIIAGSAVVGDNLIAKYAVDSRRLQVIHSFIDTKIRPAGRGSEIRESLGLKDNEFIIGGAGTPEWRKGTDLLIPLMSELLRRFPHLPFKIIWIGGKADDPEIQKLKYDAVKCNFGDRLIFVNAGKDYLGYMSIFDVFILPSREDPFPLIALEASLLEKPILAFEQAGGVAELLSSGGGALLPYLALDKMAEKIAELYDAPAERIKMGVAGRHEVESKYDATVIAPKIVAVLKSALS